MSGEQRGDSRSWRDNWSSLAHLRGERGLVVVARARALEPRAADARGETPLAHHRAEHVLERHHLRRVVAVLDAAHKRVERHRRPVARAAVAAALVAAAVAGDVALRAAVHLHEQLHALVRRVELAAEVRAEELVHLVRARLERDDDGEVELELAHVPAAAVVVVVGVVGVIARDLGADAEASSGSACGR